MISKNSTGLQHDYLFACLFIYVGAGDWMQGFVNAKHTPYHYGLINYEEKIRREKWRRNFLFICFSFVAMDWTQAFMLSTTKHLQPGRGNFEKSVNQSQSVDLIYIPIQTTKKFKLQLWDLKNVYLPNIWWY